MRYHFVFHGEVSSVSATSRDPSHLMLAMPTQPGSTSRTGKPCRTGSGPLTIDDAITLDALAALDEAGRDARLLPPDALLADWTALRLAADEAGRFDGIAPPANQEALARQIPGADLRWFDGGHAFFLQDPMALPAIADWLSAP